MSFFEKRKQKLEMQSQKKQEAISQEFNGSKINYYIYYTIYWLLIFISILMKSGFIPIIISLASYYLIFDFLYRNKSINFWVSIFISFTASLVLTIVTIALLTGQRIF